MNTKHCAIQTDFQELFADLRLEDAQHLHEYLLVTGYTHHVGIVVHRNDCLSNLGQNPKRFLIGKLHSQQKVRDEVETLAVPDVGVSPREGCQYILEGFGILLSGLHRFDSPGQIQPDGLLKILGIIRVINQPLKQPLVILHGEHGPRCQQPDLLTSLVAANDLLLHFLGENLDEQIVAE